MSLWWLKRVKISAEFLNNVFGYEIFCINITMFHDEHIRQERSIFPGYFGSFLKSLKILL